MTDRPFRCVVDASVGIKLFVDEEGSDRAFKLFQRLRDPATRFYVPDLFYYECANILWKYVERFGYSEKDALRDVRRLQQLALTALSPSMFLERVLPAAIEHSISAYDASYLAVSLVTAAPLVTADQRLARKLQPVYGQVYWLEEFS